MKRYLLVSCWILLQITRQLHCEEFTTLDGDHYTGATLRRVEPDGLVIAYADGIKKLKFKSLHSEVCAKYSYNVAAEKDFLEKSHAEDVKRSQQNQYSEGSTHDSSFLATTTRNHLLDEKIKVATYNCEFIKKRISSIDLEISAENTQGSSRLVAIRDSLSGNLIGTKWVGSSGPSQGGLVYLKEELEKRN